MSNARNLARLLPNASGQLPPANVLGGKVLQVLQARHTTGVTTTDTVNYTTVCAVTVTPASTSSRFLVMGILGEPDIETGYVGGRIFRDGLEINKISSEMGRGISNTAESHYPSLSGSILDAPATTSTITYYLKIKSWVSGTARIENGADSSLTVMEIAG